MDNLRDLFGAQADGVVEALGGAGRPGEPVDEAFAREAAETWLKRPITDEEWVLLRAFLARRRG